MERRKFIRSSVAGAAAISVPLILNAGIKGANDRVRVAVIGIRGMGQTHIQSYSALNNVEVSAICDVDENLFPVEIGHIEELGGAKPKTVVDFRDLCDDKDIDAISIATPDHWHGLQTIWACQAGKDVYIEKPLAWSIGEGRKMVDAARKYDRIVQIGTNYRSNRMTQKGIQLLQDGIIGDIYMGRATIFGHRRNIGRVPDSPVLEGVHWDLHRGPAPMIPFNKNHFHYNWHWYWDTATGEFGNNGVHGIDRIRVAMKKNEHPVKIGCCGGFYAYDSDQEVPNLQVGTFEYEDGTIIEMEVRSLYTPGEKESIIFLGTEGYAQLGDSTFETFSVPKPGMNLTQSDEKASKTLGKLQNLNLTMDDLDPDPEKEEFEKNGIAFHFVNFLDCVRSRNRQDLNSEVEGGHLSTAISHLGNIAYKTGRKLIFDGKTEKFVNDDEANTYLTRQYRHPYVLPDEV